MRNCSAAQHALCYRNPRRTIEKLPIFQKEFYERLPKVWGKHPVVPEDGNLRSTLHLPVLIGPFGDFLSLVQSTAPHRWPPSPPTAFTEKRGVDFSAARLFGVHGLQKSTTGKHANVDDAEFSLKEFLSRAYLQPYAEYVTSAMLPLNLPMTVCRCPRCNSLPMLGRAAAGRRRRQAVPAMCVLLAGMGIPPNLFARIVVRSAKTSCRCLSLNSFLTFAWNPVTPANTIYARLI